MQDEEQLRFSELVGDDVKPLPGSSTVRHQATRQQTPGMRVRRQAAQAEVLVDGNYLDGYSEEGLAAISMLKPHDYLEFVRPGVQQGVYRNMRLGKYDIQSRLDLHGYRVEEARVALWRFVEDCHASGVRCALVTHGKGEGRETPALLKSCVNHWLRQLDTVLAFHTAQKQHGGLGATYLLVRKSAEARRKTSERLEQDRHRGQ